MKVEIIDIAGGRWYTDGDYEHVSDFEDELNWGKPFRVRVRENSEGNWRLRPDKIVAYRLDK